LPASKGSESEKTYFLSHKELIATVSCGKKATLCVGKQF
jgi:hypothetical protein